MFRSLSSCQVPWYQSHVWTWPLPLPFPFFAHASMPPRGFAAQACLDQSHINGAELISWSRFVASSV